MKNIVLLTVIISLVISLETGKETPAKLIADQGNTSYSPIYKNPAKFYNRQYIAFTKTLYNFHNEDFTF